MVDDEVAEGERDQEKKKKKKRSHLAESMSQQTTSVSASYGPFVRVSRDGIFDEKLPVKTSYCRENLGPL